MSSQKLVAIQNRLQEIATKLGKTKLVVGETPSTTPPQKSVAICGMLGRGKSSLINAILGNDLLLVNIPADVSALSCYYITVTNATRQSIKAHLANNIVEDITTQPIDPEQLRAWGNQLQFLELQAPFSHLPRGLQLIETPSIGSLDFEYRTRLILEQVNSVILVIDANLGLNNQESEFLISLPKNLQEIIIAANKVDIAGTEMQATYMRRIVEQVDSLELDKSVEILQISVTSVADNANSYDWSRLIERLANLAQIASKTSSDHTISLKQQATHLLEIAENLQATNKAKQLSSQTTTPQNSNNRKIADLAQTQKLIQDVIKDQEQDILKTVRNSLEAVTFQIESDIRAHRKTPQSVQADLQSWLDREQQRMKERLERHFRSILEDTNYAVKNTYTLNVELEEIRVHTVRDLQTSLPSNAFLADYGHLGSIGAGAVTAIASLLFFGGRLLISFTVGGTVAACAWVVVDNLLNASKREVKLPDLANVVMPEFERNVRRNQHRLNALVERAFAEAIANLQTPVVAASHPEHNNIDDQLASMITELKAMI
ncbi:MAG: GTPase domain-containing protein [Aulosira sp. DedQUE10]|nr:GTPase domain-containing protein [Aulosira sp. DedQUE10]